MTRDEYFASETQNEVPKPNPKPRSGIVSLDDMYIGQHYIILGRKNSKKTMAWSGMAFTLKAVQLPFIVIENANQETITLNSKHLDFIKTDEAFFAAQKGPNEMPMRPPYDNFLIFSKGPRQ